jgi:hypothetical protein
VPTRMRPRLPGDGRLHLRSFRARRGAAAAVERRRISATVDSVDEMMGGLEMNMPGFTAEASLYPLSEQYRLSGVSAVRKLGSVVAQQLCRRLGQSCGGIDLVCCRGLSGAGAREACGARKPEMMQELRP